MRCNINTNLAYLEVGFRAQKELPQQDLDPFLKSLLSQNFRARDSAQYTAAALAYLRHYQECLRLWESLKYLLHGDWTSQIAAKDQFMYASTGWRTKTASELKTRAEQWFANWIRADDKAASPVQRYRRLIQSDDLTADAALRLLDASGLVGEWTHQTYEQADMTFTDLTPLSEGAILKCPTVHMHITKRLVPWIFESGRLYRDTSNGHIACHSLILPFLHPQLSCRYEPIALNGDYLDWRPQNIVLGSSSKPMFRSQIDFNKKLVGLEPWMHEKVSRDPMNARPTAVPINPDKKIDRDDLARYKFRKGVK